MNSNTTLYEAIIVGSGFSGIAMAISLKKQGVSSFIILEKANDFGGTWRDNTYPGAECDVPSALYSYSFEPYTDWDKKWSGQAQILEYLKLNIKKNGLEDFIHYNKEFQSSNFNEDFGCWELKTKDGSEYRTRALITAIGQLHHPKTPSFKGKESFKGTTWHSVRWNHNYNLEGKRVGVIGNAASAIQFIPEIVDSVKELTVFQRTAKWMLPKKNNPYSDKDRLKFKKYPFLLKWERNLNNTFNGMFYHVMGQNKTWKKMWQNFSMGHLKKSIKDPELLAKLTPNYPIGANRVLLSDNYYPALSKSHVDVNVDGISHFVENGIVTNSGGVVELDALIYATGFESHPFLKDLKITGVNGKTIDKAWEKSTDTYLGIATSGFPNLFMMYGPNTNLGHSSVILMIESQSNYITKCVKLLSNDNILSMDVKEDFQNDFTKDVNDRLKKTAWALVKNSWYKQGETIVNNWPGKAKEYNKLTKEVDQKAYNIIHTNEIAKN
ncbi:MAG: NAD(P)/FAD-dependent oxidoreductase [Flavobacteriaceae bacterium]|nr:NAD(P)/FAD-dependent oxidoreductase [Flavobacteriaceae bacterium]